MVSSKHNSVFLSRDEFQYVHHLDLCIRLFLKSYTLFDFVNVKFFIEKLQRFISNRIFHIKIKECRKTKYKEKIHF